MAEKYPKTPHIRETTVSSFFFLRLLNPILIAPHMCKLHFPEIHSPRVRRTLMYVAKTLQVLASFSSSFGAKEQYMAALESLVKTYSAPFSSFLLQLAVLPAFLFSFLSSQSINPSHPREDIESQSHEESHLSSSWGSALDSPSSSSGVVTERTTRRHSRSGGGGRRGSLSPIITHSTLPRKPRRNSLSGGYDEHISDEETLTDSSRAASKYLGGSGSSSDNEEVRPSLPAASRSFSLHSSLPLRSHGFLIMSGESPTVGVYVFV